MKKRVNIRKESRGICRRIVSGALALVLMLSSAFGGIVGRASATTRNVDTSIEKTYTKDAFAEEYSAGYLRYYADGYSVGSSVLGSNGDFTGTNKAKDDNAYIDIYGGAVIDGVEYDVREYVWLDSSSRSSYWQRKIGSTQDVSAYYIYVGGAAKVYREFHIYKKGTLKSANPVEVEFKGIMHFSDLDASEGYQIVQGYAGAWVMARTKLSYSGNNKWLGTEATTDSDTASQIWVQVEGNVERPMVIMYETSSTRHANIGFSSVTFYYTVNYPDGESETTSKQIAEYGTYTLSEAEWDGEDADNYEFSGWFEDPDCTEEAEYTVTLITSDEHYYGTFAKIAAGIKTTVEHGKITAESTDEHMRTPGKTTSGITTEQGFYGIRAGNETTIKYEPEEGYELSRVVVDGENVSITEYPSEYKFYTDEALEDHDIKVYYKKKSFPVETEVVGGEITEGATVEYGDEYTVSYRPESEKYELVKIVVDGEEVSIEDYPEEYTFVADGEHEIYVEYKVKEYEISTEVIGGEISDGGTVEYGDDYNVRFNPNEGYELVEILVDGVRVEVSGDSYTFDDVRENHEIVVRYEKKVFGIETEVVNGEISDGGTVEYGDDYTVTFNPNEGYELAEVMVDGISVEVVGNRYEFSDITGNHKIKVVYKKIVHTVSTGVLNGEISDGGTVEYDGDYTVEFSPNEGYRLSEILVDGSEIELLGTETSYSFQNIREDHDIFVKYVIKKFGVRTEVIGGAITESGVVDYGNDYLVEFNPNEGYELVEVLVDGVLNEATDEYIFEDIRENHEIVVRYEKKVFTVETEVVNGEISDGGTVEYGDDYTVTFNPNEGYELAEVMVDGSRVEISGDEYMFEDVRDNHEIIVRYKKKVFNIQTEVENGVITEGGEVEFGEDYLVEFSPNEGYELAEVTVDGISVEVLGENYNFSDVRENHEIVVRFREIYVEPEPEPEPEIPAVVEPETREITLVVIDNGLRDNVVTEPVRREANDWSGYAYYGYTGGNVNERTDDEMIDDTDVPVLGVNSEGGDCGGRCKIRLMDRLSWETIEAIIIGLLGMLIWNWWGRWKKNDF